MQSLCLGFSIVSVWHCMCSFSVVSSLLVSPQHVYHHHAWWSVNNLRCDKETIRAHPLINASRMPPSYREEGRLITISRSVSVASSWIKTNLWHLIALKNVLNGSMGKDFWLVSPIPPSLHRPCSLKIDYDITKLTLQEWQESYPSKVRWFLNSPASTFRVQSRKTWTTRPFNSGSCPAWSVDN